MFDEFERRAIALENIQLDALNPRIVTLRPLGSEDEIIAYFFEHENLGDFVKKIANEGLNPGAETPFVVKSGGQYTVVEGNTRIAAYKLLAGLRKPPKEFAQAVPKITAAQKAELATLDCAIAPDRESLLPIMASAHFGLGDKSKWGYLGSRKAVYDEWSRGRKVAELARIFNQRKGQIRDFILEYKLFLETLSYQWRPAEREKLEDPGVKFNPPVRFLQGQNHKSLVGVDLDRESLQLVFTGPEAKEKLQHLVRKLVIKPQKGLGATATYNDVFADYVSSGSPGGSASSTTKGTASKNLKSGALFNYPVTIHSSLIKQLAKEARNLNCNVYPAAGTFLLRNFIEAILKHIIDDQKADPAQKSLSLESALNLCISNKVNLHPDDKRVLSEFRKSHLDYTNLGAHGSVIPNSLRLFSARDCIDLFIKRNV